MLTPLRDKLPAKIFNEEVPQPPSTAAPGSLRANLLDELQGIQGRYQSATRAWEEAQTRLRDARSRAEMGAVDRVIVTDAGDAQAPVEGVR